MALPAPMPRDWVQAQSRALAVRTAAEVNYRYRMARVHAEIEAQKVRRRENFWLSRVGRAMKWFLVTLVAASIGFAGAWFTIDRLQHGDGLKIAATSNGGLQKIALPEQNMTQQEGTAGADVAEPMDSKAASLLSPDGVSPIDVQQLNRLLGWGLSTPDALALPKLERDAPPKQASETPLQQGASNQLGSSSVELDAAVEAAKTRLTTSGQTRSGGLLNQQRVQGAVDGDLLKSIEASRSRNTGKPRADVKASEADIDSAASINPSVEREAQSQSFEVISRFDWGVMVRVGNQVKPVKKGEVLPDGTQLN